MTAIKPEVTERDREMALYGLKALMASDEVRGHEDCPEEPDGCTIIEAIASLLATARAEGKREAMLALESLTAGGSEFVGDIEACVSYIRIGRQHDRDTIARFKKRADEAFAAGEKRGLERAAELVEDLGTAEAIRALATKEGE